MFYIIENLKHYLGSDEIQSKNANGDGLFLGRRFIPPGQEVFNSGGAGYVINKKSLQVLGENLDSPKCFAHQVGFWEDVNIANCLRKSANIVPYDTRDDLERQRFHPFTPGHHLSYRIDPKDSRDWYPKYHPYGLKEGFDCCSVDSISFHYVPMALMRQLYSFVYHCKDKHQTNNFGG